MCHILKSSRFEVQVVAMAQSSSELWPTYYAQCPCCRSLLEIDRYGCCLIRDDVVRSCTTQDDESEADSEDVPVVPTVVVSDSDDNGLPIVATLAPNAADAAPTVFYPEDAASAWSCAAPNAAAVTTTMGATAFGAAPSNAVVGAGSMASSSLTGARPRPSSSSIAGSTAAGSSSKCGGQRALPWPKQASRDAGVMDAGTKRKRE